MSDRPADKPRLPGQAVDLPPPPELGEAFGYRGHARFVGFSSSPAGEEASYDDIRSYGDEARGKQ